MITLVTTVFNDREGLQAFFDAMAVQSTKPAEIVIVDAESKDGSWEFLEKEASRSDRPWTLKIKRERCNVARGRNLAIREARHEIIASTDIGCDWDPEWLQELSAPFSDPQIDVVIGSWCVKPETLVGPWAWIDFLFKNRHYCSATVSSQSTSRSIAYKRQAWSHLGGYPEDLSLAADDTVFDMLLKQSKLKVAAAPIVRCYWHRHEALGQFLKEEYRYFLGNGEALITLRHFLLVGGRFAIELASVPLAIVLILPLQAPLPALAALLVGLLSVSARLPRWRRIHAGLPTALKRRGFGKIICYEYRMRLACLRGYAAGLLRGRQRCTEVRRRLREADLLK